MKTMLSIEGTPEELANVLALLAGNAKPCACGEKVEATVEEAPTAEAGEKPKRSRRTKAEIEAERAQEADAPAVSGPTPTPGEEQAPAPAKEYSQEEVRAKLVAVSQKLGDSAPVKAKIAEMYEGKGFGQLAPADYPALVEWLEAELAA